MSEISSFALMKMQPTGLISMISFHLMLWTLQRAIIVIRKIKQIIGKHIWIWLGQHVEEHFNESFFVDYFCDGCDSNSLAEKRLFLKSSLETKFMVVLLRRSVLGDDGNFIVTNKIKAVDDIKLM